MSLPLFLLAILPTIWIVDAANGPGTNFTDIPAAVTAAANGDTILVRPGTYTAFNVNGKALTMRGAGAGTSVAGSTTTISGVPSGSVFYVSGMAFVAGTTPPVTGYPGLRVVGSEVALADVTASGVTTLLQGTPGLWVEGGSVVHAARCSFTGTLGYSQAGGHGALLVGGLLAADACTFTGGGSGGGFFPVSGAGIVVNGGAAVLSRCSAFGGNATLGFGGHGIAVLNGFARIAGNSANLIHGGTGSGAPGGNSIFADANSTAVVHGNVVLQGPITGAVATPASGTVPLPYLSFSGTVTSAGELQAAQSVTLTLDGQIPNAPFALLVDVAPTFSSAFSPVTIGELLVPVSLTLPLEGTLNGAGVFQLSFTPGVSVPAFLDMPLYSQAAVVDVSAGKVRLSNGWIRIFKS
jgi:hypothetical protein